MMRPSRKVIAQVDRLVAEWDRLTLPPSARHSATSSYEVVAIAWKRFKRLVDGLDLAVASPFEEGAADLLLGADILVQRETFRLAFWLVHVGEAINSARQIE